MKSAVVVFPASNCDRDAAVALEQLTGKKPHMVWHQDSDLPDVDLVVLPGGFAYGDYLRCGAMAAQSPIMRDVKAQADKGGAVLGICNGFPGADRNRLAARRADAQCRAQIRLPPGGAEVEETQSAFTRKYDQGPARDFPGRAWRRQLFRRRGDAGPAGRRRPRRVPLCDGDNPNGSARNIAGILNEKRNVLGLMPHPERVCDPLLGGTDGGALFESLIEALS